MTAADGLGVKSKLRDITPSPRPPPSRLGPSAAAAQIPKPIDMGALPGDIHRLFEVRASRISAELLPPTVLNVDIPLPQESAEARAKQLLKLSNSLSLYPWEW